MLNETPLSEPEVLEVIDQLIANKTKNEYPETIFRSSYHLGEHLLSLFVNFRKVSESYSFIIRKGKWNTIYNLTKEERFSFIKNCAIQLSPSEKQQLILELK